MQESLWYGGMWKIYGWNLNIIRSSTVVEGSKNLSNFSREKIAKLFQVATIINAAQLQSF